MDQPNDNPQWARPLTIIGWGQSNMTGRGTGGELPDNVAKQIMMVSNIEYFDTHDKERKDLLRQYVETTGEMI